MRDRVLAACEASPAITRTLLVTPTPDSAPASVETHVDAGTGHADAIAQALADPRAAEGAVVVMADCPLATPDALDRLAAAADPIALVPARDGGVNALALAEADAVDAVFGVPNAAAETVRRARMRAFEPAVLDEPGLALDVDEPSDVWELREQGNGTRTHGVLEAILPSTGGLR